MSRVAAWLALVATMTMTACHVSDSRPLKTSSVRFFLESTEENAANVTLPQSQLSIPIGAKSAFTEFDLVDVEIVEVAMGKCLAFTFTSAAARDLYRLTASNQGRRLVLLIDGKSVGARRIDDAFGEGRVLIFIEMSDAMLPAMAENLRRTARTLQQAAAKR